MIASSPRLWRASARGARKEPNMRVTANQQINNIHARVLERGTNKYHMRLLLEWGNDAVNGGNRFPALMHPQFKLTTTAHRLAAQAIKNIFLHCSPDGGGQKPSNLVQTGLKELL